MSQTQKGILAPVPKQARYLLFTNAPGENSSRALRNLCNDRWLPVQVGL
jgi:hypothetical protein